MSVALSVFKLCVQIVRQLQQHTIKVFFEMTGLPHQWTPVVNHSISIVTQSSARQCNQCWSVLASHPHKRCLPPFVDSGSRSGDLNISEVIYKSESQFNYLFTLKNAQLSSDSYNFWMWPITAMKFAGYITRILCKHCKFGEKLPQFQRYPIFPRGYLFGALCSYTAEVYDIKCAEWTLDLDLT